MYSVRGTPRSSDTLIELRIIYESRCFRRYLESVGDWVETKDLGLVESFEYDFPSIPLGPQGVLSLEETLRIWVTAGL